MPQLSVNQLNNRLSAIIGSAPVVADPFMAELLPFMFIYGFRINEMYNCHQWDYNGNGQIVALTSKNSNTRLVDPADCPNNLLISISSGSQRLMILKMRRLQTIFSRLVEGVYSTDTNKKMTFHLFRHNRIKQMNLSGSTIEEIKTFTGIKNESVVLQYVNSNINHDSY